MGDPRRILIRAANWIGDAVMSLPAVRVVRQRYPEAHIAMLARPWVADLYARETAVDEVLPYTPRGGTRDLAAKWQAARRLGQQDFDCAILLQNAFEAAATMRIAGIRERIGYARDGRSWLLTRAVRVPVGGEIPPHERFYYLELLHRAGLIDHLPSCDAIRMEGVTAAAEAGRAALEDQGLTGGIIGVSPGAAYGTAKCWLPNRFAEAAAQLARDTGASIALFGSSSEAALCSTVAAALPAEIPVRNFAGKTTLGTFIDMAAACTLFLTNDSGAMHIASALGVPTVTVYGATNHVTTGPAAASARIVREPVSCSPCLLRECPIDHRCMTRVPVSRVVETARELLLQAHS